MTTRREEESATTVQAVFTPLEVRVKEGYDKDKIRKQSEDSFDCAHQKKCHSRCARFELVYGYMLVSDKNPCFSRNMVFVRL